MKLKYFLGVVSISTTSLVLSSDCPGQNVRDVTLAAEVRYRQVLDRISETKQSEEVVPWSDHERQQQAEQAQTALVDLLNSRLSGTAGQYASGTPGLTSPVLSAPFSPASGFASPVMFASFAPVTGLTPAADLPQFVQHLPAVGQSD